MFVLDKCQQLFDAEMNVVEPVDGAVAAAYGWTDYAPKEAPLRGAPEMPDDEIFRRLLALNLERAAG